MSPPGRPKGEYRKAQPEGCPVTPPLATVVGAGGFIGAALMDHLQAQGWHCRASPREAPPGWFDRPLGTVFFCAGLTADFAQRPHDTVAAHVGLLSQVLRRANYQALLYLSSTRLYDSLGNAATSNPVHEDDALALDPAQPRHLFDLSKALGEALCRHAGAGRARVARLSCVVRGADEGSGFIGHLLAQVQGARERGASALSVASAAQAERDYVCMDDVLSALVLIATRGSRPLYNVASGVNLRNSVLFEGIRAHTGLRVCAHSGAATPGPAPRISIARMQQEFNWLPKPLLQCLPQWLQAPAPQPLGPPAVQPQTQPCCA